MASDKTANIGVALSPDSQHMVVTHASNTITVYSLPEGGFIREFGEVGTAPGQFISPNAVCSLQRATSWWQRAVARCECRN